MATIQDLGKVAYFNKGMYNSETNYEINDVVSYNGSSYVSLLNNNQGNLPTNATYWSVVALKGDKGDTGKPFVIEKTYESIEDMVADYDNMQVNDYVMIQGNIEEEENATLWTKTETEVSPYKWVYLADFSGASGITGATPNIQIGTVTEGNEPAVTRRAGSTNENPILDFVLKTGATGETGATGNGISNVSKTSTSGLTDTYTITFTNGNTTTFNVSNGKGIASIVKTGTSGLVDTYTITYNDGTTSTYTITNGEDGEVTQEQLDETNSEIELVRKIYNAFPTTSDEDESITLNGTAEVQFKNFELKGNTSQNTTTGKNLFDNVYGQTGNVYTKHINAPSLLGSVDCYPINLLPNTQYTLKIDMNGYQKTGTWIAGVCFENGDVISLLQSTSMQDITTTTFTTDSTGVVYVGQRYGFTYGETGRMDLFLQTAKIQLEKGTTATDWEKYSGGNPAPNPDYPQDIQVVSGDNSIKVEGKNLFDTATIEQGGFNYHTGENYTSNEIIRNTIYNIKPNTQYTISCNKPLGECAFCYFDKNGNSLDGNFTRTTNNNYTITTNSSTSYIKIRIGDSSYPKVISDSYDVQLEQNSTATSYVPYQSQSYNITLGNLELCKIGDYQDSIVKDNGKWYLHKEISKVVLDGSEDWAKSSKTTVHRYSVANIIQTVYNPDVVDLMSNYFTCITQNQSDGDNIGLSKLNANGFMNNFDLSNTGFDTLEKYKTWLSTHNTIVYYVLATPTVTEITDNTLIGQLNALENAYSYDTQTNITQTNDDMPFILDVEAILSLRNVLNS